MKLFFFTVCKTEQKKKSHSIFRREFVALHQFKCERYLHLNFVFTCRFIGIGFSKRCGQFDVKVYNRFSFIYRTNYLQSLRGRNGE